MSSHVNIDLAEARRVTSKLEQAARDLRKRRDAYLTRLAIGAGERPVEKSRENIMVTVGVADTTHSVAEAGEALVGKLKDCGDAYIAAEEGIRAMSAVMSKMVEAIGASDELAADDLNRLVEGLHRVAVVEPGTEPESIDWFGLGRS